MLLAQNNAILMQLAMGRNDTLPGNHCVPPPQVSVSRNLEFRIRETSKFV